MANFNVTVTEILGTDSMNNSRVTINNNFKTLAQTINQMGLLFNGNEIGSKTSEFSGSKATIGGVTIENNSIKIGSSSLDDTSLAALLQLINNGLQGLQGSQGTTGSQGEVGSQGLQGS